MERYTTLNMAHAAMQVEHSDRLLAVEQAQANSYYVFGKYVRKEL